MSAGWADRHSRNGGRQARAVTAAAQDASERPPAKMTALGARMNKLLLWAIAVMKQPARGRRGDSGRRGAARRKPWSGRGAAAKRSGGRRGAGSGGARTMRRSRRGDARPQEDGRELESARPASRPFGKLVEIALEELHQRLREHDAGDRYPDRISVKTADRRGLQTHRVLGLMGRRRLRPLTGVTRTSPAPTRLGRKWHRSA